MTTTVPDERARIRTALRDLARTTALPMAFGGPVLPTHHLLLSDLVGARTTSLQGLSVRPGTGLGGKVVTVAQPIAVPDYPNTPVITHEYDSAVAAERLQSLISVPVIVRGTVRAVLYAGLRHAAPVAERVLDQGTAVARELEQELVVRDEVEHRVAQLHSDQPRSELSGTEREQVREAYAQLRVIAQQTTQPEVRERVRGVAEHLGTSLERPNRTGSVTLSPRELDVLACVALGCTNADAATSLGLLPETVKSYLRSAMIKLDCRNRTEAVAAARKAGLLP
ncbi:DNA-binding NarL/FixJ family response regulator [Saccharopolyspora lacisalsi]|uniref:DNA-binding NarL/FixJ family response regulator n=1 Tax=Halosaccharopolyspora lacisalsi TaxID=1000566 RepID=A0A839DWK3_9PSEU|nr:LuxR C-terminal-related transcriptional regulator [Halosaccharopolyspora lacisalsi]MBA8826342.1 DNA-binding NarL/FixJ family response regulator [Halosaccharopolyspora lacisalsi]